MKKENQDFIVMHAVVTESLSNGKFRVRLENGFDAIVHISGKIRRNFIRVLLGDPVKVELSIYDLTRGRIVYRYRPKFQKPSRFNSSRTTKPANTPPANKNPSNGPPYNGPPSNRPSPNKPLVEAPPSTAPPSTGSPFNKAPSTGSPFNKAPRTGGKRIEPPRTKPPGKSPSNKNWTKSKNSTEQ